MKSSNAIDKLLLRRLEAIRAGDYDPNVGICLNITMGESHPRSRVLYDRLEELIWDWPKHSGHRLFPVPCPDSRAHRVRPASDPVIRCKGDPADAYNVLPAWEEEYGALRMELVDYLIFRLRRKVRAGDAAQKIPELIKHCAFLRELDVNVFRTPRRAPGTP